jgi:hypothetical protein
MEAAMANVPVLYPGQHTYSYEIIQNGKVVGSASTTSYGSVTTWMSKTSVDTGVFTPGSYRVNPYSISSAVARLGPLNLKDSFTLGTTTYKNYISCDSHSGWANIVYSEMLFRSVPYSTLKDRVLQRAYAKVGSAAAGQGENLGEIRQTLEMLRSPLKSLRDFLMSGGAKNLKLLFHLNSLSKKQRRKLIRSSTRGTDALANSWLEFRYGFRPLYLSIMDIAEQLQKAKRKVSFDKIYSAKSLLAESDTQSLRRFLNSRVWNLNITNVWFEGLLDIEQEANAAVQYQYVADLDAKDTWGLRLQDIPETAWELTTLSFVVDWVFSVGPWLGSWRINPKVKILGDTAGLKVTKRVHSGKLIYTLWTTPKQTECPVDMSTASYVRTVNNGRPLAPIFLGTSRMSTLKVIDALALLWQFAKKS